MRQALESKNLDRSRRARFLDRLAVLVEHRADLAVNGAGHEVVADLERSILNEHGRDVSPALVDLGFQNDSRGRQVRDLPSGSACRRRGQSFQAGDPDSCRSSRKLRP